MPTKTRQNYKPGLKDLCQTPGYAVTPLLKYLFYGGFKVIWECASGEGLLSGFLSAAGYGVVESDILRGFNFLTDNLISLDKIDCIVTNPPSSLKYKFLQRCYELEKPFALLMPVDVLGSATAQKLFSSYLNGGVILLSKRVNFKMPNKGWSGSGSQFPVAWFTYKMGIGSPESYGVEFYDYQWLTSIVRKDFEI
jgi:hypothetical protein